MTETKQNVEDALAEVIDQSLGPCWTSRDAARMIMGQLSDIGLQCADNVAITEPNEAGSFTGDTWFGHPYKRALGTHQWDGQRWRALPSETDACLALLVEARREVEALRGEVARLREALWNATALIGHSVPMDTSALVAGELLTAQGVWNQARAVLGEDGK